MARVIYRRRPRPAATQYAPPNASALYGRSIENRRVMCVELFAWAIIQAEEAASSGKVGVVTCSGPIVDA